MSAIRSYLHGVMLALGALLLLIIIAPPTPAHGYLNIFINQHEMQKLMGEWLVPGTLSQPVSACVCV